MCVSYEECASFACVSLMWYLYIVLNLVCVVYLSYVVPMCWCVSYVVPVYCAKPCVCGVSLLCGTCVCGVSFMWYQKIVLSFVCL